MTDQTLKTLAHLIINQNPQDDTSADEWQDLVPTSWREGVASFLGYIVQHRAPQFLDPQSARLLSLSAMETARRHFMLRETLGNIHKRFSEAGIPVLWLKGMALAYAAYPQPMLRPMSDHDIWVPNTYIQRAYQLLLEMGFSYKKTANDRIIFLDSRMVLYWSHHYVFASHDGIVVELHNHILLEPTTFLGEHEPWFWEQQRTIQIKDYAIQTLTPVASLLHLCGHMTIHHTVKRLINYLDIHFVIMQGGIDWDEFVVMCRKLDWAWFVVPILQQTIEYFDTPIPPSVLAELSQIPTPTAMIERLEVLHRPRTLLSQVWEDMRKIPRSKLPLIFLRLIFPPMSVLKERNHDRSTLVLLRYPNHWYHLIREIYEMSKTPHQPH